MFVRSLRLFALLCALIVLSFDVAIGQEAATANAGATANSEITEPKKMTPEAQVAAKRGIEMIQAKEYKKAIELFLSAAKVHPRQSNVRHLLGYAYAQDKQLGQAWLQFRQAVRLNPQNKDAIRDFLKLWQVFEKQGVFNAGRTNQEIAKLVGKPDGTRPQGGGEVWEYGFKQLHFQQGRLLALIDPRGLDASITQTVDKLEIEFDDQSRWRLGYRSLDMVQSLTEYIPNGQGMQKWDELYTIQRIHKLRAKKSPSELMKDIETNLKKANPNVEFRVLEERDGDVLYHWRDVGDPTKKRLPQHEIVRLIAGNRDIHRLAYTRRVAQIPAEDAKNWVSILGQAKLVSSAAAPTAAP